MATLETASNNIRNTFDTEFADEYSVQYDNAPFTQPDDEIWVRMTIVPLERVQTEMGSPRRFRRTGMMIASIFAPLEQGDKTVLELADRISIKFTTATYTDVVFRSPSIQTLGRTDNRWYQVNVNCPFFYDETKAVT